MLARMSLGYTRSMRAVMLEVPEWFLEDRRRKGQDKRDEVWAGVLHMVPPPSSHHNSLARDLLYVLRQLGTRRGLVELYETGVFDPVAGESNYRVPDLVLVAPEQISKRGIEGVATLVVEVLSPNDESRDKLPFYARVGVREVWLIDPTARVVEIYAPRGDTMVLVAPANGLHRSPQLGVELVTLAGPRLSIRDGINTHEI